MHSTFRLLALASGVALALSLSACGGGGSDGTPTPTPTPTDASVCFPTYKQAGKSITSTFDAYSVPDASGKQTKYTDTERFSYAKGTFNGVSGIVQIEVDDKGLPLHYSDFFRIDSANKVITALGFKYSGSPSYTCNIVGVAEHRYNLLPGQSYTSNFSFDCTDPKQNETFKQTATFAGFEKITVPAGTFDACKLDLVEIEGGQTDKFTVWFRQGDGVELRTDLNGTKDKELVSVTIK